MKKLVFILFLSLSFFGYGEIKPIKLLFSNTYLVKDDEFTNQRIWKISVHLGGEISVKYIISPTDFMGGAIEEGVLKFDEILEETLVAISDPSPRVLDAIGNNDAYSINIYSEINGKYSGTPSHSRSFDDPTYWNNLLDEIKDHITYRREYPSREKEFWEAYEMAYLPTPALEGKEKKQAPSELLAPNKPIVHKNTNLSELEIEKTSAKVVQAPIKLDEEKTLEPEKKSWIPWCVGGLAVFLFFTLVRVKMRKMKIA